MAQTVILGAGVMGTAFAYPLCDSGVSVDLVGTHLDDAEIAAIRGSRRHPRLPTEVPPSLKTHGPDALPELLAAGPDLLVLGVSSPGVEWAAAQIAAAAREARVSVPDILMLTKGLDATHGTLRPFPHRVAEVLEAAGLPTPAIGGVGGPCIASELARRHHSGVIVAGPDRRFPAEIRSRFSAPYYHVTTTTDLVGVEASAALKNFYTIAVAAAGAGNTESAERHNPAAALFAQAVTEMALIAKALGGEPATVHGLAGVGDLYVTCRAGRNSRLGSLLGRGISYSEVRRRQMPSDTIEGADLASVLAPFVGPGGAPRGPLAGLELPVARAVIASVCEDAPFVVPWESTL